MGHNAGVVTSRRKRMAAQPTTYLNAETSFITFGDRVQGFLARPAQGQPPYPGVILYHERYGLVQHTLDLAAKFALYGYVALAPDLFSRWEGDKEALNRGLHGSHLRWRHHILRQRRPGFPESRQSSRVSLHLGHGRLPERRLSTAA